MTVELEWLVVLLSVYVALKLVYEVWALFYAVYVFFANKAVIDVYLKTQRNAAKPPEETRH